VRIAYCAAVVGTPQWYANFSRAITPPILTDLTDSFNSLVCDRPSGELSGQVPVVVQGGQCPGVSYEVRALGNNGLNETPINVFLGNFVGPIRQVEFEEGPAPKTAAIRS